MIYTGYLRAHRAGARRAAAAAEMPDEPYILVTTGGGGDGDELIDWVLRAYEHDPQPAASARCSCSGPFMPPEQQAEFLARAARLPSASRRSPSTPSSRALIARRRGVVAMGGYNTFCEILSFDKPALIVPRTEPRLEQFIRAERARASSAWSRMLPDDGSRDAAAMAAALRALPQQPAPSASGACPACSTAGERQPAGRRRWLGTAAATARDAAARRRA